jgi:hypothetical protein
VKPEDQLLNDHPATDTSFLAFLDVDLRITDKRQGDSRLDPGVVWWMGQGVLLRGMQAKARVLMEKLVDKVGYSNIELASQCRAVGAAGRETVEAPPDSSHEK